jgi:RNA polymerase sigma factor (sigma-70 family)
MGVESLSAAQDDRALLDRFVRQADPEAFEELLHRHAAMVRATCRRHLGDTPDADDAFQVAFLVLVRRASSIRRRDLLGPWLYGVAIRSARKTRELRERRQNRERSVKTMPEPSCEPEEPRDWLPLLDDAVESLPEKYRVPLVLCELRGVSRAEAASTLALEPGTLSSRLARAREMLRDRLLRRGVSVSAIALAAALVSEASAAVPASLIGSTKLAVLSGTFSAPVIPITQGVIQTMFIAKIKTVAALLISVSVLFLGAGLVVWSLNAQTPATQDAAVKKDKDALQGDWTVVEAKLIGNNNAEDKDQVKGKTFVFKGDKLIARGESAYTIDPSKKPKEIEIVPADGPESEKGKTFRGIYELKGDELKITFNGPDQPRPKAFDDIGSMAMVLQRVKDKQ